jgi:tRNA-dihydrouridine synthase 3
MNWEEVDTHMKNHGVDGVMVARGALIKPWIFTEIKERRHWDISATERFDMLKTFVSHGLEHWGADARGVETTRRFLLEWLSFTCRYVPVGLLEVQAARLNWRPRPYIGRSDLETKLASSNAADWIEISEMLLGKVPESFSFVPKHKSQSYDKKATVGADAPDAEDIVGASG